MQVVVHFLDYANPTSEWTLELLERRRRGSSKHNTKGQGALNSRATPILDI